MPPEADGVALAANAWCVIPEPTLPDTGQCAERISGQTASFTVFQKEKARPAMC
jgi:hypothetical protein